MTVIPNFGAEWYKNYSTSYSHM